MSTIILWDGHQHFLGYNGDKTKNARFYRRMISHGSAPYAGEEIIIAEGNVFERILGVRPIRSRP